MDLTELAHRSDVDRRRLRYVLDHQLVPQLHIQIHDKEWGRPRYFAEDIGFGIVCAARLLEAELPHKAIQTFLTGLLEIKLKPSDSLPALAFVLQRDFPAVADFGDGKAVRLRVDDYNSGWFVSEKAWKPAKSFDPLVVISLNVGRIRDQVFRQ